MLADLGVRDGSYAVQARTWAEVRNRLEHGTSYARKPNSPATFAVGDRVRTRMIHPQGHARLPRFVRGQVGTVVSVHGAQVFPDRNAVPLGQRPDPSPEWIYTVEFAGPDLWGPRQRPHGHRLCRGLGALPGVGVMTTPTREQPFDSPWQAQVFALTVALQNRGVIGSQEWAQALGARIATSTVPDGSDYYDCWAAALADFLAAKGLVGADEVQRMTEARHAAAARTPHGQPIVLAGSS